MIDSLANAILSLNKVRAGYGDALVLQDVSVAVPENGALAVLGRNGVGKSTMLLTIMGNTQLRSGTITFRGTDISGMPPHSRARAGIGWVAQEREIFPSLTVEENLTTTARSGKWDLAAAYKMFPRLQERRRNMGNQLSGGEQQMLAIARILHTGAKLLLLDEISEGLAPVIVQTLGRVIRTLKERGYTIIMVEQNFRFAAPLADRHYVIEHGRIVETVTMAELDTKMDKLHVLLGI